MGFRSVRRGFALLGLSVVLAHAPARAGDPPPPADTVAGVDAEWAALRNPTPDDFRRFLARYRALPDGKDRAVAVARRLIEEADPNDREARAVLGHKEFTHDVPEEISYRRYPFVRIVEEAGRQRWFEDPATYANALEAFIACQKHAARLTNDPAYSALDVVRRGMDQDQFLRPYNYDAIFASPFLICYSTKERIDEAAMWKLNKAERAKAWAELDARREPYKRVLAEKARIYTQVYERLLARYGEACGLKPLMDPFGGRPDYPVGKRSFREGCPLTVWVFSDADAWRSHHETVKGEWADPATIAYLEMGSGRVFCYDQGPEDRRSEILTQTRLATLSALHWFARQRDEWAPARPPATFFSYGFPDWFSAATLSKDRTLTFRPMSSTHVAALRAWNESRGMRNLRPIVIPLATLLELEGDHNVRAHGAQKYGMDLLPIYRAQSFAFFAFLDQAADGKRRPAIAKLLDAYLSTPRGEPGHLFEKTREILGIQLAADWAAIDAEFKAFYDGLLKPDAAIVDVEPPALSDWPGYVAPDLLAPTGPAK